jgi:hypothetical protein
MALMGAILDENYSAILDERSGAILQENFLAITAFAASVSTASGAVVTVMALSGTALSASTASGSISAKGVIAGTSGAVSAGLGRVVLLMRVSGSSGTVSKADGYLADLNRLTGLAISQSQADGWIGLPIIVGALPDEVTAIVWVSNALGAELNVNVLSSLVVSESLVADVDVDTAVATIETNEISAGVTEWRC